MTTDPESGEVAPIPPHAMTRTVARMNRAGLIRRPTPGLSPSFHVSAVRTARAGALLRPDREVGHGATHDRAAHSLEGIVQLEQVSPRQLERVFVRLESGADRVVEKRRP